ncbi:MAG: hypothetical protein ACLFWL_05530 [Candidatus Brocadiia bacterium]
MYLSVTKSISHAFERTNILLFQRFDLGKWLILAFCAFLASLSQGGMNLNFNFKMGGQRQGPGNIPEQALDWLEGNPVLAVAIVLGGLIAGLAITALLQWLSSRGHFMFLDGVVHNRAAVVQPWKKFRVPANSFFFLRFAITIIAGLVGIAVMVGSLALAYGDIQAEQFGAGMTVALVIIVFLFLPLVFGFAIIHAILQDFIVPIMYKKQVLARKACSLFLQDILPGNLGAFTLFYLMKLFLGIAFALLATIVMCLTCCLAALPYVNSVVFLPVSVFFRNYSLCFLNQFGGEWQFFQENRSAPHTPPNGTNSRTPGPNKNPPEPPSTDEESEQYRGDAPWVEGNGQP